MLTELHVLVVSEYQDDVGADVPAVPLKPAFQAVVRQEGGAPAEQRENRCGEQAQQEAGAGHFMFLAGGRSLELQLADSLLCPLLSLLTDLKQQGKNQVSLYVQAWLLRLTQ